MTVGKVVHVSRPYGLDHLEMSSRTCNDGISGEKSHRLHSCKQNTDALRAKKNMFIQYSLKNGEPGFSMIV